MKENNLLKANCILLRATELRGRTALRVIVHCTKQKLRTDVESVLNSVKVSYRVRRKISVGMAVNNNRFGFGFGPSAVSYTHLDVYKRQAAGQANEK